MELQSKTVVVTGAARGIGLAIAKRLASKGCHLALLDLDEQGLQQVKSDYFDSQVKVNTYVCDVSNETQVVAIFKQINDDMGSIHGLVNNAGVLRDATLIKVKEGRLINKMSEEDFSLVVDVHLKGAFLCGREAASNMALNQVEDACIINISSGAYRGNFGQSNYSAAKAGMVAMSQVWAKELGRHNIRSMAIAPGVIETDMLRSMPKEPLQQLTNQVPLKRIGQPDHIAQTVQHILENDYLSGGVIDVCGGLFF